MIPNSQLQESVVSSTMMNMDKFSQEIEISSSNFKYVKQFADNVMLDELQKTKIDIDENKITFIRKKQSHANDSYSASGELPNDKITTLSVKTI